MLSERAAYLADLSKTLKKGDVVDGVVRKLTDFGAFVSIKGADGEMHGTDVRRMLLIHIEFHEPYSGTFVRRRPRICGCRRPLLR